MTGLEFDHSLFQDFIDREIKADIAERFQVPVKQVEIELLDVDELEKLLHLTIKVTLKQYEREAVARKSRGMASYLRDAFKKGNFSYYPTYTPVFEELQAGVRG